MNIVVQEPANRVKSFCHIIGGTDCRIQSIRDMLHYYGRSFSPEICFGLGEGLTFHYWQETKTKIPMLVVSGRNMEAESIVCRKLGIKLIRHQDTDPESARDCLLNNIFHDIPVMLDVDRYYLPHLASRFGDSHFGQHTLIVVDFNKTANLWSAYDFTAPKMIWISDEDLTKARSSEWQPFPPSFAWYEFAVDGEFYGLDPSQVIVSINNVCATMLSQKQTIGVNAINAFAQDIEMFKNYLRGGFVNSAQRERFDRYVALQINFTAKYISEIEPTGTLFRSVYGNFLKQASYFIENKELEKFADRLKDIGETHWQKIAHIARSKMELIGKLNQFSLELRNVAEVEKRYFTKLADYIKTLV